MSATGSKKFMARKPEKSTHKNVIPAPHAPSLATHQVTMATMTTSMIPNTGSMARLAFLETARKRYNSSQFSRGSFDLRLHLLHGRASFDDQAQPFFLHIPHAVLAGLGANG